MLERFADTLPQDECAKIRKEIEAIIWTEGSANNVCVSAEGEEAFERAGLMMRYRIFVADSLRYTTQEDLKTLAVYSRWANRNSGNDSGVN